MWQYNLWYAQSWDLLKIRLFCIYYLWYQSFNENIPFLIPFIYVSFGYFYYSWTTLIMNQSNNNIKNYIFQSPNELPTIFIGPFWVIFICFSYIQEFKIKNNKEKKVQRLRLPTNDNHLLVWMTVYMWNVIKLFLLHFNVSQSWMNCLNHLSFAVNSVGNEVH